MFPLAWNTVGVVKNQTGCMHAIGVLCYHMIISWKKNSQLHVAVHKSVFHDNNLQYHRGYNNL